MVVKSVNMVYTSFVIVLLLCVCSSDQVILRNPSFKIPWEKLFPKAQYPRWPKGEAQVSPVIFIPGDAGSQLEAKLDKPSVVHYVCAQKTAGYFDLWLNIQLLLPYVLDCWIDNIKLNYNNVTDKTENSPGVDIRVVGFGNSTSVEYLDKSRISISKYFVDIANVLVANGYKRDVSIRAAPYDFRKAPNELGDYFVALKKLVEETYEMNNQTAVTFIPHSMGNLMGLHFLHQQTPEWKAKYMKSFISLGAPWGGAVKAMKAFASGENMNVALISAFRIRAEQRTNPSLTFIFPHPDFWDHNQTFVQTPSKNYSISNMQDFFLDMNVEDGWEMYKRTADLVSLRPPGVPMYCMYGVGVDTPTQMIYVKNQFPDTSPRVLVGDGDGTVNRRSLEVCALWQKMMPNDIHLFPFPGINHMTVLSDKSVLNAIGKVVFGLKEYK